jgi:hypothetical protein
LRIVHLYGRTCHAFFQPVSLLEASRQASNNSRKH